MISSTLNTGLVPVIEKIRSQGKMVLGDVISLVHHMILQLPEHNVSVFLQERKESRGDHVVRVQIL